ncbi:hypothetical protein [Methanosphaerula palustris]|uniref:HEPN domain protein n=1 Tax=Methanosphaerula palustris (strain ATCC BAA-1556 / DSM 19958 / E1-9c) TaxID=521011 RepID=B8GDK1_METPE|nr:hypothetical protein [Methanosphaerula palustris]ACL17352.1 hypothetical protein Mpal_2053 [Methanosphaerula palustris E1-9c]
MQKIFSWEQFIDIAQFLVQETKKLDSAIPDEAAYRCAISRSYYAAFCCALEFAEDELGYNSERAGTDHTKLRNFMKVQKDDTMVKIAGKLDQLRGWRNTSDYNALKNIPLIMAENAILQAQEIVKLTR